MERVLLLASWCLVVTAKVTTVIDDVTHDHSNLLNGFRHICAHKRHHKAALHIEGTEFITDQYGLRLPECRGEHSHPIRIVGKTGHDMISGGIQLTNWKTSSSGQCVTSLPKSARTFKQLFVNGKRATRARFPSAMAPHPNFIWKAPLCDFRRNKSKECSEESRFGFVYNGTDVPSAIKGSPLEQLQVVVFHGWTTSRHWVTKVDTTKHTIHFSNPSDRPIGFWPNHNSEGGGRYFVDNTIVGLQTPGSWFLNDGTGEVTYNPLKGESCSTLEVYAPQVLSLFQIHNHHHVHWENLVFSHVDWYCGRTEVCDKQSTAWSTIAAFHSWHSTHMKLKNVTFRHIGDYAVQFDKGTQDCHIVDSTITDLGTGGIRVGNNSAVNHPEEAVRRINITNNYIQHGGFDFPSGTAVFIQHATEVSVHHNEMSDFAYTAINLGWDWSFTTQPFTGNHSVQWNHIHDIGRHELGDAMACVYSLHEGKGSLVNNNLCTDLQAYYTGGYCLSQDQGSQGLTFTNNVCLRTTGSPQNQHYGIGNAYENNIFAFGGYHSHDSSFAGDVRTSPRANLPNSLTMERNIIILSNSSDLLFEGDWRPLHDWKYTFDYNLYWSTVVDLRTAAAFGGCSKRTCREKAHQYTFKEWQQTGEDTHSTVANPHFVHTDWYKGVVNVTLAPSSPALQLGFQQIDLRGVGVNH
eukprot:TRINITY_DN12604_c0_g1_i1.p1 TRINITY_DN12604_c0_g1~~TRINITY_DN12604_c0_g1_i1.p1  ORF type:complete len:689 (-),score=19.00 TRINITY_DN12604_c0_g1_i1:74-2140(-)